MDGPIDAAARARLLCDDGQALYEAGDAEAALARFSEAVALAPNDPRAHFHKGFALLLLGRWHDGFAEHAWRARLTPAPPGPAWEGEPLNGRRLLLWPDQGLGDSLMLLRYAPLAAARGGSVVFAAEAPLVHLLAGFPGLTHVHAPGERISYDLQAPLSALPRLFATTPDRVPPPLPPRLPAPTDAARRIAATPGLRVGLVWAGNPRHPNDARRSCPLAALAPLLDLPGLAWYGLHQDAAASDRRVAPLGPFADLADTAAALAALDLVVSVDTAVAHLAGTLGKSCWLLLPFAPDWRWLHRRSDTPWYPAMTLFRQPRPGEWDGVAEGLTSALRRVICT
jgi:tetratricopeptide (TPR) repeat protein